MNRETAGTVKPHDPAKCKTKGMFGLDCPRCRAYRDRQQARLTATRKKKCPYHEGNCNPNTCGPEWLYGECCRATWRKINGEH